jgi:L-fuconolactonase
MPEPDAFGHLPQLLALAKYPNIAVKLSGAAALSEEPFPFRDLPSRLRMIIDAFGPERCIWASDFYRCLALHTLGEAVTFMKYGDWLSDAEREMILAGSLRQRYGWPRTD